jgi:superfamily I DNA/RNA helicase
MATLVFEKNFLDDFAKLEPSVRQKVRELPGKFENAVHSGLHLEKPNAARDDRIRTVRVDQSARGVVVQLGDGKYALLRVLTHDDAYAWAIRQRFDVNPVTGIVEILDIPAIEATADVVGATAAESPAGLFVGLRDRDFTAVGIDKEIIPVLRRLRSESELLAVAGLLPTAQGDAVLLLADGKAPDEVWAELSQDYALTGEQIDTEDLTAALERPASRASFVVTSSDDELVALLSGDFEAWRTFLHPSQQWLAYRPEFKGPARVTGGAGTGKTVVVIHRARFLAQQLLKQGDSSGRVLLATYTSSLADNLNDVLRSFCSPTELRRIEVMTVDAFARQTLAAAKVRPKPATSETLRELADEAAAMSALDQHGLDGRFLVHEWEQVILARRIDSLAAYASSPRPGRGRPLQRAARKDVWSAVDRVQGQLAGKGLATFIQSAEQAGDLLTSRPAKPFAHVVVDEAQDLHPAQWRLLRAAVAPGPNDLFIAGDAHQRIYDYRVSLSSLGIETRGRSRQLKINYRTSQQILGWALAILTGEEIDDLDGEMDRQIGYRSAFSGPAPTVRSFPTPAAEATFVAERVNEWIESDGVAPSTVGVVGRTRKDVDPVRHALAKLGVASVDIGAEGKTRGVNVGTMHSSKGLEFARLAVVGASADRLPLPIAVTPAAEDPTQHALDVLRERCLLYVACTRARDELLVTSSGTPSPLLPGEPRRV